MEINTTKLLSYFLFFAGLFSVIMVFLVQMSKTGEIITLLVGFILVVMGSWIYPQVTVQGKTPSRRIESDSNPTKNEI